LAAPLEGIRILDLTILVNGPWATVLLADMGADVIKVEDPVHPDPYRGDVHGGVDRRTGLHTYFETMNRNKRSIALDLKQPRGREVFYRLVRDADVVISNFRPGVVERLGLDYERLVRHNPRIVTVTASGLGRLGPDAQQGVVDLTAQARSGYLALTALDDGTPRYVGSHALADQVGAMLLAWGTLLAIVARERHGIGQDVEVSQLGSMLGLQALAFNNYLMMGVEPTAPARAQPANPLFNLYRTHDGRWLSLACFQFARYWAPVCRALGLDEHVGEPAPDASQAGQQQSRRLTRLLAETFATRDLDEWLARLRAQDVVCAPVQSYGEVARDPQVSANELLVDLPHPLAGRIRQVGLPVKLSRTPGAVRSTAPEHGQHTEEVLLAAGYSWDELARLRAEGVLA
jgi:crotonobetainyl-CoA:carnitine CoA-transferase CaiB-like acyl-CoA transferase